MSETVEAAPQEIFQQPLDASEQEAVEALVAQHRNNAAQTQQLAVDASRLITCSEERLKQQAESGFFKRFAGAFTGKSRQNQLQNQVDALHMQKFAWHYLKQLQQQNLINAQSIAVIRNNLGTMNEYIIETREFLFQAVDKINRRLIRVENNTSFHQWSLNIEANKRRFKSMPKALLVLNLAYDFMRSHPGVALTAQDINHLIVTLEKLDVDCDEEVELLGFIIDLIDQIEATSIERYRTVIELSFEEHVADSYFIQKNISGLAFNSLYYLSDEYDRIIDMISDGEVCDSDEKRERIISRFFGKTFSGLYTQYRMRDLIEEIIGGSLLTLEIYKDQHGLNALPDEALEDAHAETVALVSSLPDINAHSFFDTTDDREARHNYLLLFALCIENSGALSRQGREFLELLAHKAGCPQVPGEIATLADNPRKAQDYLPILQDLLKSDDETYTWLLDAFYLLTLCQKAIEGPHVLRILNTLKPAQFKEQFPRVLAVLTEQDEENILAAAEKLQQQTHGWKNIVRYRELRFEKAFSDMSTQLGKISFEAVHLSLDLTKATMKASDYSYFMEAWDDSFLSKVSSKVGGTAYTIGRSSCLSSLNEMRKKISELISGHSSTLNQGNRVLTRWGLPSITFKDESGYADFELDNSATNEDWYDQFSHFERQLDDTLTSFSEACTDVANQLDLFAEGRFDESVVERKEKQHAERLDQQQQEKLAKQSVVIEKDGHDHLFSIEWRQVEHPPCDPEKIQHIKTDGTTWLIVDNDDRLYRSLDREHWHNVRLSASEDSPRISKLDIVSGIWIAVAGYSEGFYYSHDAQNWKQSHFPDVPGYEFTRTEEVCYFNGLWLWRFRESKEYSYIEKGLIFDSTKTGNYDKIAVFCTANLDNQWQRWEDTPSLPEGVVVESLQSLPNGNTLLAFCKYDWLYKTSKKKNNASSFVSYFIAGKGWRTCTWASEDDNYDAPLITRMGLKLLCFYSDHVMASEKNGYEWKLQSKDIRISTCAHLQNMSLFSTRWGSETLYVSQTGESFAELVLEEGTWKHIAANEQGTLSVYSPNKHETFLRSGNYICQPKA
ncbi:TPA: hypothetical protein ACG5BG_005947 [Pseudomonas aeruginosa]|uniref:hypothetical protein n=1 Tax=Pseudomonas aeruginosa TaxID=287 RepID=UPI000941091D|nr:hypothetical protein [Pseudomonas aeruginosa]ELK4906918.1 hypothetical protein [Pseudomonas aeruginosa]MBG6610435.1 hypothetical protein [Pseudomonas aeruginosa]MDV6785320.1 hypothetical protein [Pseudomonas aeruginosa]RTX24851.1 hypothetical protein DZA21_31675 [Pseudomonas aeruginosa]HBO5741824.1 hypothetical protein [Pseudomonas aeruginosa]